jgi:hypothetical protein
MKKIVYAALILVFSSIVYANEANSEDNSYVCVSDVIIGLPLDEETHARKPMEYEASRKYLVKPSTAPGMKYVVEEIGGGAGMQCSNGFEDADLFCTGSKADFKMNRINLGYLAQGSKNDSFPTGTGKPFVEVGECTPQ